MQSPILFKTWLPIAVVVVLGAVGAVVFFQASPQPLMPAGIDPEVSVASVEPAGDKDVAVAIAPKIATTNAKPVHLAAESKGPVDPAPTKGFVPTIDDYGSAPGVAADSSPAAAAAAHSARTGENPERLSAMMQPPAITRESWEKNRAEILATTAPGRVWQVAKGGEGVPYTTFLGENDIEVVQGQTIELRFRSAPDAPLSLFTNGLGSFSQGLTSISVATDQDGYVTVPWTAISGTLGAVTVVASSPFAQGTSEVAIEVVLPVSAESSSPASEKSSSSSPHTVVR